MILHSRKFFVLIFLLTIAQSGLAQRPQGDTFLRFVEDIKLHLPSSDQQLSASTTDEDLRGMGNALVLFRAKMLDSCKTILARFNYTLVQMVDATTGATYDIIKERYPIRHGWGTFIYNRNHTKRLYIHVNHPIDDPNVDVIGAELFQGLNAEWLFIAGTPKFRHATRVPTDIGRAKRTVFQRWHEMLTDLTHITLSLHAYRSGAYQSPINSTDVVVSNGKTTDEQWGISQISLAFRDSLKASGLRCSLAMYDSGYASLSGGWNTQGIFSNDSAGFGHWFSLELSERVRDNHAVYSRFVAAANRALDLTGKKVSHQMNLAWGLVSPRVVRVDSMHRMLFPPPNVDTYRVVAFNAHSRRTDTLDIRMGNWLDLASSSESITRITRLDSTSESFADRFGTTGRKSSDRSVSRVVTESTNDLPRTIVHSKEAVSDSSLSDRDEGTSNEPLQVHRIPLQPILATTISNEYSSDAVLYRWPGLVRGLLTSRVVNFEVDDHASTDQEAQPSFLIPIINSSYQNGRSKFIGVQMTHVLINEIARLVNQHNESGKEIGLIAEEGRAGDYYLRIFPGHTKQQLAELRP